MVKKIVSLFCLVFVLKSTAFSQATNAVNDPELKYKQAKELFVKEQYALSYPLFVELKALYPDNTISNHTYINDDVNYYHTVCQLKLMLPVAEPDAKQYIDVVANEPRREMMSFHLAQYYYKKDDFSSAVDYYERAGYDNLSNEQIADMKFEKGYCYFNLHRFEDAQPLFDEIRQMPKNKYYFPANYYSGYISYNNKKYNNALEAFKVVENHDDYKSIVPYYIATIYYFNGKKDEALAYGENALQKGGDLFYEKDLKLLLGQLYFEKQQFKKALPHLEYYVSNSEKVSKEVMYELSFCYYNDNNLTKAIEGFKQLSNEKDAMGQNSMYLLGDCYLRTGQKANARNAFQYCAYNSSNKTQQQISRFNYAKLSYELGYQDIALSEMKKYLNDYPNSEYDNEAKEILVNLLANTNNFRDALELYESFSRPTANMQKVYPKILYGRAVEYINDQQLAKADELLIKVLNLPASTVTPFANFWRGEIAYRNNKYDEAIRYLSLYVQAGAPTQGEANAATAKYDLGYCWLKKENYKNALSYFEPVGKNATVTSNGYEQDAYVRTADCNYMLRDFTKANTMYDYVISTAMPQSDYAMMQKASIAGIKSPADKIKTLDALQRQYPQSSLVPDVNMEIANTYMADEKFTNALPYLDKIIAMNDAGGLKPLAYLKSGLCYFNLNQNTNALAKYEKLVQLYPQSNEADEALENMRDIYIEEGRPNDYVELMKKNGKPIATNVADSITYAAALIKYNTGDCNASIAALGNYINQYPDGANVLEANYFRSECYYKAKDYQNAMIGYNFVNKKGYNRYFERSTYTAAQINYFEFKDYAAAKTYFESLRTSAVSQEMKLEASRGLVRCYYQLKDYNQANIAANELLAAKGISTDDKSIGYLVLGKSQQIANDCIGAIASFKSCATINKSAWGAEARYELANCQFKMNNITAAEKAALAAIKETGSYDMWVTKSYILLGDIFMKQKDYFNAKATYESVSQNAAIPELKAEAQQKYAAAVEEEKGTSKVGG